MLALKCLSRGWKVQAPRPFNDGGMCGIAGLVRGGEVGANRAEVEVMVSYMGQRGPDHSQVWSCPGVSLGHTRLSIIDLDPRSHQPFLFDERIALAYNGEIYNFKALRAELEGKGHSFYTTSDTEVLVHGYLEWGSGVVSRLDGMFAFGLLDREANKLILARDPFGKKPLYVYHGDSEILFCSDIRPIHRLRSGKMSVNLQAIDYYFSELSVPQPETVWNQVAQIAPAGLREIDLSNYEWSERRYWKLPERADVTDEKEALSLVESALLEAIQKRTVADVPLGCFLSGGVDSGLVVSLLASHSGQPIKTYTVTLEGHAMDEAPLANLVAERYQTDHTEIRVESDLKKVTELMCDYCGEPFADSSIIPSFLVAREISKHVKVALSGDGGDELFGGYKDYLWAYKTDHFLRNEGRGRLRRVRVLTDKVLSRFSGRENLGSLDHYSQFTGAQRMYRNMGFDEAGKRRLWKAEVKPTVSGADWLQERWDEHSSSWLSDHLMRASLSTRLVNDYLVKVDRSSMYHSLEVRSPLLDRSLAELAFRISPELKFKGCTAKYLLKVLAGKYFAPDIFERKKTGFSIPLHEWLTDDRLSFAQDILLSPDSWLFSLLERAEVVRLWGEHQRGRFHTHGLWALVCLELWARSMGLSR